MSHKFWTIIIVLMMIGGWLNLMYGVSEYLLISQPHLWDAIKVIIDFLVAVCWTIFTVVHGRRRQ